MIPRLARLTGSLSAPVDGEHAARRRGRLRARRGGGDGAHRGRARADHSAERAHRDARSGGARRCAAHVRRAPVRHPDPPPRRRHDPLRLAQLGRFSLLPLDANAWIAKGQAIAPRSVVLVHGNGNEPPGISGFLRAVQGPRESAFASGRSALVSPLLVAPSPPTGR